MSRLSCIFVTIALSLFCLAGTAQAAATKLPSIALYYGEKPPLDELKAFDVVVVESDNPGLDPNRYRELSNNTSELFAYASIGEIEPSRPYLKDIPQTWLKTVNKDWNSHTIDQSAADWPAFFAERVIGPLWSKGYRGFFIDTLDSYQLFAKTNAERTAQEAGLKRVIRLLRQRYPGIKLIFNRGFEILPDVASEVYAVAAESLYQQWIPATRRYQEVPASDREWLLAKLNEVKDKYRLPVLAIDYVAPKNRALARDTAKRIMAHGFIPWVTNGDINMLGVGSVEVLPRKVLLLYDKPVDATENESDALRFAVMPLNYLGYSVDMIDIHQGLPNYPLRGRYAGIVTWMSSGDAANYTKGGESTYTNWLGRQLDDGLRLAVFNNFGFELDNKLAKQLGLALWRSLSTYQAPGQQLNISQQDPLLGFEFATAPNRGMIIPIKLNSQGHSLLQIQDELGQQFDQAAITDWGGYALSPFSLIKINAINQTRWVIQPIEFLRRSLMPADQPELALPAPDVTTENGRRLMIVHVDGDGFASRAEVPGTPFASEVMLNQFLNKYRVPSTVSIIQGEIAANGLYPKLSPALEDIARKIFALPNVEIASHSFSHPFIWSKLEQGGTNEADSYNLHIPNYQFDLTTEIQGSAHYIDSKLAPAGKKTQVFLWTGNCVPGADAISMTYANHLLNMNGGDTFIDRQRPTWSFIAPLGIRKNGQLQIFAANQNENVYTHEWTGPYYGFERVLDTFAMTETPYRLKPINIYYHTYSASKPASIGALDKAYRYALAQDVLPVYASDYIRKVIDFDSLTMYRELAEDNTDLHRIHIKSQGDIRTLRLPGNASVPDLANSEGIAGYAAGPNAIYTHMTDKTAVLSLPAAPQTALPYLALAAGRISQFKRQDNAMSFQLDIPSGLNQASITLGNSHRCLVSANNKVLARQNQSNQLDQFIFTTYAKESQRQLVSIRCPE